MCSNVRFRGFTPKQYQCSVGRPKSEASKKKESSDGICERYRFTAWDMSTRQYPEWVYKEFVGSRLGTGLEEKVYYYQEIEDKQCTPVKVSEGDELLLLEDGSLRLIEFNGVGFANAICWIKNGDSVARKSWETGVHICMNDYGKILLINVSSHHVEWVPRQEELLANDWYRISR